MRRGQDVILCVSNLNAINPTDGATATFGAWGATETSSVAQGNNIYAPRPRRIIAVRFAVIVAGTLGTTEQATASVRVNATTDTTISSVVQYNAVGPTRFDNTSLNISLAADDFFFIKVVFPTFVTNPTSVYHVFSVVME